MPLLPGGLRNPVAKEFKASLSRVPGIRGSGSEGPRISGARLHGPVLWVLGFSIGAWIFGM